MKRLTVYWMPLLLVLGLGGRESPAPQSRLVVHEWGTITTRHAPNGIPDGRLNRIGPEEVLPDFVHRYEPEPTRRNPQNMLTKTPLTPGRPDVTMRLETPVIYFYPPAGGLPPFDVAVSFRGGVLNEFYPAGAASVDVDVERVTSKMNAGLIKGWDGKVLDNYVVGDLQWTGLRLKKSVSLPATSSHVWLAPRRVQASGVETPSGEGERYLFYRGVAHLDALLQTELSQSDVRLRAPQRLLWMESATMIIPSLWLVDIRADGRVAFRHQNAISIARAGAGREVGRASLFRPDEFAADGRGRLRGSMKEALTGAGLFDDEAEAMLETVEAKLFRHARAPDLLPRSAGVAGVLPAAPDHRAPRPHQGPRGADRSQTLSLRSSRGPGRGRQRSPRG